MKKEWELAGQDPPGEEMAARSAQAGQKEEPEEATIHEAHTVRRRNTGTLEFDAVTGGSGIFLSMSIPAIPCQSSHNSFLIGFNQLCHCGFWLAMSQKYS